jgi:hypothetical protein
MQVIRSSGSVRGGDGNIPAYSAQCRRDRGIIQLVIAIVGIRLQDAAEGSQMQHGIFVPAVA